MQMANYQHIKFLIDDRVARITFARPPVNILNIAMMREINDALNFCSNQRELVAMKCSTLIPTVAHSAQESR